MNKRDTFSDVVVEYLARNWLLWTVLALAFIAIGLKAMGMEVPIALGWNYGGEKAQLSYFELWYGTNSQSYFAHIDTTNETATVMVEDTCCYYFMVEAVLLDGLKSQPSEEIQSCVNLSTNISVPFDSLTLGSNYFKIQASTNLAHWFDFTSWMPLTNPMMYFRVGTLHQ